MSLVLANKEIGKVYLGDIQIDKAYKGNILVYSAWEDGVLTVDGEIAEELGTLKIVGANTAGASGATVTIEDNCIYTGVETYVGQNSGATVGFENPVNVDKYNTLYALVDYNMPAWSVSRALALGTTFGAYDKGSADYYDGRNDGASDKTATQKTLEINISSLTGDYYVSWFVDTSENVKPWIRHYKIWME